MSQNYKQRFISAAIVALEMDFSKTQVGVFQFQKLWIFQKIQFQKFKVVRIFFRVLG